MSTGIYIKHRPTTAKLTVRFFSYISMTIGFALLMWSFYPIVVFELTSRLYARAEYLSPIQNTQTAHSVGASDVSATLSQNVREFIQINDWFPSRPQLKTPLVSLTYKEYWLTIPKLNIQNAKVTVGGADLTRSLVHYLPTTSPGEYGSVNIFGHSTLPQLYNVKDYKTIFTYLPSLARGDTILITVEGQQFEYEIDEMFVVKPDQVSVLEPRYDASYVTLITCVPPGTFWERLIVRAKLKHLPFKSI